MDERLTCSGKAWSFFPKIQWSWHFRRCSVPVHPLETRFVSFDREMNSLQDGRPDITKRRISCAQKISQHEKSNFATCNFSRVSNFVLANRYFPTNSIPVSESPCETLSIHVKISEKKPARKFSYRLQERAPTSKNHVFRKSVDNIAQRSKSSYDSNADVHTSCDSRHDCASMVKVSTLCGASVEHQRARTMTHVKTIRTSVSFSRSFTHV
jgi:hypothetical protein